MTKWVVVGSGGQLGQDLTRVLTTHSPARDEGTDERLTVGLNHRDLDIADPAAVHDMFETHRPDIVVNTAAYTAVDQAETEVSAAYQTNAVGPTVLAEACSEYPGTRLVQLSTDYVFGGEASEPYPEDALTDPRTVYGESKRAGEQAILRLLPEQGYVLRTAWLYSQHGRNFVRTILGIAREEHVISVVDDQIGQPTWSHDLAERILDLMTHPVEPGIYHATNSGQTTWFGFAREILRRSGQDPDRIKPIRTSDSGAKARRPRYSVLGHERWDAAGLEPMRPWQDAIAEALPLIDQLVRPES